LRRGEKLFTPEFTSKPSPLKNPPILSKNRKFHPKIKPVQVNAGGGETTSNLLILLDINVAMG